MATRKKKRPVSEEKLLARARAAAKRFGIDPDPKNKLSRSEALNAAPWDPNDLPDFERAFRIAFADALEKRGAALAAKRPGKSLKGASGESVLIRRTFKQTQEEYDDNDRKAKAAGLPWNTWVRRKLAT